MRAVGLVLVLTLVILARNLGGVVDERFATMALGFVLIVAALAGEAGERVHLPRLTGYLLVGLAAGPAVLNVLTPRMAGELRLVNGLAVALIAFSAGMEMDLPQLSRSWRGLLRHGGVLILLVFLGLFLATLAASPWLPFTAGEPWLRRAAVALVVAAVMATFSPTVTMAVLAETRARGPLADRVLALVVLGDLGVVLIFTLSTALAKVLNDPGALASGIVPLAGEAAGHVAREVVGSLLVGALVGAALAVYRRVVDRRSGLVVAAACLVVAEVGSRLGLSSLLTCLMAGLVVRNVAPAAAHEMEEMLGRVRMPVLVVFFAASGASLHLAELPRVLPVVVPLVLVRMALVLAGNRLGARSAGFSPELTRKVPFGLVSQAGVTLGLAVMVGRTFGDWGATLETLFVATISLHELIGPVAFRWALGKAGEVPPPEVDVVLDGLEGDAGA